MQSGNIGKGRRSFIKKMAIGSAVLAGFFSTSQKVQAEGDSQQSGAGEVLYRETEDFKRYYETLRS